MLPMQGMQVQSLVRELWSHMSYSTVRNKRKEKKKKKKKQTMGEMSIKKSPQLYNEG